jgi:DNA-binding response OmpR family regulator
MMNENAAVSKSILIVDDEEEIREFLVSEFKMMGWNTDTAVDGRDAQSKIQSCKFDLIVSDMRMPHVDGFQLLKSIRHDNPKLPPVFLISGFSELATDTMKTAGADAVFSKPLDIDRLIDEVTAVFKKVL